MRARSTLRFALTANLLATLLVPMRATWCQAAGAQEASPAPAPETKAEARSRFDRGLALFEKGDNPAALAEFKRAFELIPKPIVLYNIGLVYAAMNHPVEASDALDRFLADPNAKATAEQRAHALQVRAEQATRVAKILVVSDPPATVEIDGVEAGRTPMTEPLRVASGSHTVGAIAPGYQASRQSVTLAGQVIETVTFKLAPTEASAAHLSVVVATPGAEVWINGKLAGVTPLPGDVAVSPGTVRVEIRRAGYRNTTHTLQIDNGANARLDLALEEDPAALNQMGRLRLVLSDAGTAELFVDGKARSLSSDGLLLPLGPHMIRIRSVGFEPYESATQVIAGRETTLMVALRPTLESKARIEDARNTRGILGWSLVGGGAAITVGAGLFAILTRNDVSDADANLTDRRALETMKTVAGVANNCYLPDPKNPLGEYLAFGCAEKKAELQSQLDSAKLKRTLAFSGIGIGAIATGLGTYFLATRDANQSSGPEAHAVVVSLDGTSAFASVAGHF